MPCASRPCAGPGRVACEGDPAQHHPQQRASGHSHHHGQRFAIGKQAHNAHGGCAGQHLQGAQQGGCRAGDRAMLFQRQHRGGGYHQPHERAGTKVQADQHRQVITARQVVQQQGRHHRARGRGRRLYHPHHAKALTQRGGELGGADERRRVNPKSQAVLRGRKPIVVDEHKGRARQIHKKTGHGAAAYEHQAQVVPVAQ